jgi:AAA+ ATPase superfamily predicted ATPase
MSINTEQGELLIVQVKDNKVYCDACRDGMTKKEALDYSDSLRQYADSLTEKPEYEYCRILDNSIMRWFVAYGKNNDLHTVFSLVEFDGYADAEKNRKHSYDKTCKYVVLRKVKP